MQPSGHRRRPHATDPPRGASAVPLFPDAPAFANFVPLPENRSALAAFQELARCLLANELDQAVNPLYLHGPAGVGKSCLVNALVEEVPGLTALVLSANAFPLPWDQDEASAALERYEEARRCDLLAVEDLQHLPTRMTESLVQLLDERLQRRLPTIFTASGGPGLLAHRGSLVPARLTNRLASGLVVALPPPPAPSRLRLLQELARRRGLSLAENVLRWLAETLTGGRQLEGALHQIESLEKLNGKPLTLDALREQFQVQAEAGRPTVERIIGHVSAYFRVEARQLQSARRNRSLLMPRHVSMYLARRLTRLSLQQIGAYFGGRDHSTVLHACRKVEDAIKSDATLSGAVGAIHAELA